MHAVTIGYIQEENSISVSGVTVSG